MLNVNYSSDFSKVLLYSKEEAVLDNSKLVTTKHLLLGLLRINDRNFQDLLSHFSCDAESLRYDLKNKYPANEGDNESDLPLIDATASLVLKQSITEAVLLHADCLHTIHLLLAILKNGDTTTKAILERNGLTYQKVKIDNIHLLTGQEPQANFDFDEESYQEPHPSDKSETRQKAINSDQKAQTPCIDKYGIDLTAMAQRGELDPLVGRANEIRRIAQILSRRRKNNPILIGEPGVGKTAIVEGLAQLIIKKQVPPYLMNKRLIQIDMPAILAGTKYRGQFEERIQALLNELRANKQFILFIDEIHTIIGAGSAAGSMDAANMLKPALSRGELQCIGATTTNEYRKTIEKDGALERRFQKIMVEPTTPDETLTILQNLKDRYEKHHHVIYTDEALEACVRLTDRYISDRKLPDKAIDALDESGSRSQMTEEDIPADIKAIEEQIEQIKQEKNTAVSQQDFQTAANMRSEEIKLTEQLHAVRNAWIQSLNERKTTVGSKEVEETVSLMSGIPVQKIASQECIKLKNLKNDLLGHVVNQDKAIETLVKAITRSRIGLRDPKKPIGSFLFLGPTGVGKTYLAKKLAEYMFGSENALIRIDMSEYMEKFSTSRLVGAPPGYVGYDEGGQLTEQVRRKPYSVILLDEIEKASKDVSSILLQVMDEGRLTDNNGTTVDFKNTILIITSNCGTRELQDFSHPVGFTEKELSNSTSKSLIDKALHKQFAPEFLNRLDEIIVFNPLKKEAIEGIAKLELEKLRQRLNLIGYDFKIDKKAMDFIVEKGYDPKYGARPLRRAMQTYIEDGLSDFIISSTKTEDPTITITHKKGEDNLSFS